MSEADRFETKFGRKWRRVYKKARGAFVAPAEVADACVAALSETLRNTGGCPSLREMAGVVEHATWRLSMQTIEPQEEALILIDAFNGLGQIVRKGDGHRNTKVAARAAESLLTQYGRDSTDGEHETTMVDFVQRTCLELVEHHFLARARANLVAEAKLDDAEKAWEWHRSVVAALPNGLQELAERLTRDPLPKALRAPERSVKPQSTRDLLEEVLASE